jgi:hypothetical protein
MKKFESPVGALEERSPAIPSELTVLPPAPARRLGAAASGGEELQRRFDSMCNDVRVWTLEIFRNIKRVADHLCEMKRLHEALTGTGWGKRRRSGAVAAFDEEVARRTGVDRSLIRRYCRVGQLDPETSRRIDRAPEIVGNLTLLYRLVQVDPATRHRALDAYAQQGRPALDRILLQARDVRTRSGPARPPAALAPLPRGPSANDVKAATDSTAMARAALCHTFDRPPESQWLEHRLSPAWVLRVQVVVADLAVSSLTVQLVPEPVTDVDSRKSEDLHSFDPDPGS